MNKIIAKQVNSVLNTPLITETLNNYIDFRIENLRESLEKVKDIDRIRELQGAIEELRKFRKLRETAIQILEVEN